MKIVNASANNIELFSKVLMDSAKWLDSIEQSITASSFKRRHFV